MSVRPAVLLAVIVALLVSACNLEAEVELYASDVTAVRRDGEVLLTPMLIKMQAAGMDRCQQDQVDVAKILSRYFKGAKFEKCEELKGQMHNWMVFSVETPIANQPQASDVFTVLVAEDGAVSAIVDAGRLSALKAEFKEFNMMADIDLNKTVMNLIVNNDQRREALTIDVKDVFVNARPYQTGTVTLETRDRATIQLSNVDVHSLLGAGDVVELFRLSAD